MNCVSLGSIRDTRVLDDHNILFRLNGRKEVVNHLPRRCPGLGRERRFGYRTSLSQLCSQDIIWVIEDPPIYMGSHCGLGKFEPYIAPADTSKPGKRAKMEPAKPK